MTGGYPATICFLGSRIIHDVLPVGHHRRAVHQMHEPAVQPGEARRVHGARRKMTTAAAEFAEQPSPLLRQRFAGPPLRQPIGIGGRLHRDDRAGHLDVLGAAEFGTFETVGSGCRRLEPHGIVGARHRVALDAEGGHEKTVHDILRRDHEAYDLADRNMNFVDFALAAGVLDFPHPLLADDEYLDIGRRRFIEPDVVVGAETKSTRKATSVAVVQPIS